MQSEKGTGFNNYSLCYFAKARRGLPEDADVNDIMDFYLSCCSIQARHSVQDMSLFERVLQLQIVLADGVCTCWRGAGRSLAKLALGPHAAVPHGRSNDSASVPQATCKIMAAVAGSLANGGVCPMTGEQVFTSDVVRRTLAVMQSCGERLVAYNCVLPPALILLREQQCSAPGATFDHC